VRGDVSESCTFIPLTWVGRASVFKSGVILSGRVTLMAGRAGHPLAALRHTGVRSLTVRYPEIVSVVEACANEDCLNMGPGTAPRPEVAYGAGWQVVTTAGALGELLGWDWFPLYPRSP